MSISWNNYKWVVLGDSLTDPTLPTSSPQRKYHSFISELTQINEVVDGKGGTGYWRTNEKGTAFYQRAGRAAVDPSVDVVTVFGSVNDKHFWIGGTRTDENTYAIPAAGLNIDKTGYYTFAENKRQYGTYSRMTEEQADANLSYEDTIAETEYGTYGATWVAYVNELINTLHEKYPNAKIVLVEAIYFVGVRLESITNDLFTIRKGVVKHRISKGDSWLSYVDLYHSVYAGQNTIERMYLDSIPGDGLSFFQLTVPEFRAYYTYDPDGEGGGHPNETYGRIWLAPVFANIVAAAVGANPLDLPDGLKMTQTEREDLYALWVGKPDGPTPPTPTVIAYDINGSPMTEAYDINGELLTSLYDINGEVLVQ